MKEQNILKTILLKCCRGPVRLWRQNAGMAWTGEVHRLQSGDVLIKNPRPLRAGFKGLSDLGGYRSVTITPDDVGKKVAIYCAIEVKTKRGRPTKEQAAFLDRVRQAGGIAGIARSDAEAQDLLDQQG